MKIIPVSHIGVAAHDVLHTTQDYNVLGVSTRGIFLSTSTRWILFLSTEKFKGPLTINLSSHQEITQAVETNQPATLLNNQLNFQHPGYQIDLSDAPIWEPLEIQTDAPAHSKDQISEVLRRINDPVLNWFIAPGIVKEPNTSLPDNLIVELYHGLKASNFQRVEQAAVKLLGAGSGLTPEGDDFIIGMTLSLKLNPLNSFTQQIQVLLSNLAQTGYHKTTTISANLIECAARGQADERLIAVYNALRYGTNDGRQEIKNLLNWGNTSGRMAMLGISAGLLATSST